MSGIAAVIYFDGRNIECGTVERITEAIAYRGPDGIAHWQQGPIALGHCMMRTTAEALSEKQPLGNGDDTLVLVLDGWLSNWAELRKELLAKGIGLRDHSDAELVLRAYEFWGCDAPIHLEGEFAFAIWDANRKEVFLARDHAGLRPMHYHWDGNQLVVASDIAGILAAPGVSAGINRSMITEHLTNEWLSQDETVWMGVNRLRPAHWMCFSANGKRTGKYWSPPLEVEIVYRRDEEYFEHYRELITDCVRRSSRSHRPLGIEVSGGLDSSAVFCLAHRLRDEGRLLAPAIRGYTYLFDERGSPADEINFARAVAEFVGEGIAEVPPFLPPLSWFATRSREDHDVPPFPNGAMAVNIGRAAVADNCRVILNGEGGDEWLSGSRFYYQEELAARNWSGLKRSYLHDAADFGPKLPAWWIFRYGLAHLLPRWLLDLRQKLMFHRGPNADRQAFWLSKEMENLWSERRTALDGRAYLEVSNVARRTMLQTLENGFNGMVRDHVSRQTARLGYEARYPMYARQFIEFAFAIPEHMRLRGATKKYIHVESLAGIVPDIVLHRQTKAEFSQALEKQIDTMEDLLVNKTPHLDVEGIQRLYNQYQSAPYGEKPIWELWGAFACGKLL